MTLSYIYMMYFSRISLHCPLLYPLIIIPSSFQPRCFSVFMSDFMWFFCDPVVLLGLLIGGSLQEHGRHYGRKYLSFYQKPVTAYGFSRESLMSHSYLYERLLTLSLVQGNSSAESPRLQWLFYTWKTALINIHCFIILCLDVP